MRTELAKAKSRNTTQADRLQSLSAENQLLKTRIETQSGRLSALLAENDRLKLNQGEKFDKHSNALGTTLGAMSRAISMSGQK